MSRLHCEQLTLTYDAEPVIRELTLPLPDRAVTAVVGANGSGKSTLLKAMARVLRPQGGAVLLDGRAIHEQPTREVARTLALLPQRAEAPAGLRVAELVGYGRFPYQRGFGVPSAADQEAVAWAMAATNTTRFADREVDTLSGGERQRAWIAMALAQSTDLLLLDEPTTALDIGHQLDVLDLVRRLNQERGITVVVVLHDLNHAARVADHVVAVHDRRVAAAGPPADVLTPDTLATVFGVEADVIRHERTGALWCLPYAVQPARG